jgi:hypothetical protein
MSVVLSWEMKVCMHAAGSCDECPGNVGSVSGGVRDNQRLAQGLYRV